MQSICKLLALKGIYFLHNFPLANCNTKQLTVNVNGAKISILPHSEHHALFLLLIQQRFTFSHLEEPRQKFALFISRNCRCGSKALRLQLGSLGLELALSAPRELDQVREFATVGLSKATRIST